MYRAGIHWRLTRALAPRWVRLVGEIPTMFEFGSILDLSMYLLNFYSALNQASVASTAFWPRDEDMCLKKCEFQGRLCFLSKHICLSTSLSVSFIICMYMMKRRFHKSQMIFTRSSSTFIFIIRAFPIIYPLVFLHTCRYFVWMFVSPYLKLHFKILRDEV